VFGERVTLDQADEPCLTVSRREPVEPDDAGNSGPTGGVR
jgi:hypothetical protein